MGINLDSIIAGANSVDELVSALSAESKQNALASSQILQIADAAKGTYNPGSLIKSKLQQGGSPAPAAPSNTGDPTEALYARYVADQSSRGLQPLSIEDFTKVVEQHTQKQSKGSK